MPRYRDPSPDRAPEPAGAPKTSGPAKNGRRRSPASLFDPKEGLKAYDTAQAVLAQGPLRWGSDGHFWAHSGGVYVDGEDEVHGRIVRTLGNRYRPSHSAAVRDVARALVPRIDCSPVPAYINFRNGLLDWRTNELLPHDPAVPSTVQLSVDWEPRAECPEFRAFLADVIPADDTARVWELIGYMMFSGNPLHRAFLLAGGGRNGKGAFMRTVLALLGENNVSNVPLHDLSSNRFATAQLFGRLANVCGDIDATYLENTGRVKEITGEDQVQAEHKFGQPFRFTAWCSMLFSANEIPGSADSSKGWVDRWEIVPFPNYVGDRVDRTLEPRLQAPASLKGIAAAAVPALRVLMDRGAFRTTVSGQAAKSDFARKSNPLIRWVEERVTLTADGWEKAPVLYTDYAQWTSDEGLKAPMSRQRFYEKLAQLGDQGIAPAKRGVNGFKGIKLGQL
jgi:putative DNA primase/helicase